MAVMIPTICPNEIPYDSERLVYQKLRDQLSNDFVVLHSYPWLRPDRDGALREGEADFIVLHQQQGMLVLEVKGGELRYENAVWKRKKRHGYEPITDPFKQARTSMHYLVNRIEQQTAGDVRATHFTYGHAVVFPHADYDGALPPGVDAALVISRRDTDSMHEATHKAMAQWPRRAQPLTDRQWKRLANALLPEFRLFQPIVGTAADVFDRVQEMTDEQIDLLNGLYETNNRVYVTGVAGSGKTQIAFDRAIALALSGKRTLFACYNKYLAHHLAQCLREHPERRSIAGALKIRHFHGLARELIEDAGIAWEPPQPNDEQAEYFNNDVCDLIEQAVFLALENGEDIQFDAVVIDEAQDFHTRWWEVLQCVLLKDSDNGTLFAFSDPFQKLWEWAPSTPPVSFPTHFRLQRNCRNSRWIARTSTALAKTEVRLFKRAPIGSKPKVNAVVSMPSMKGIVMKVVEDLMHVHDLRPSQIVMIGPRSLENGSLGNVEKIAGIPLSANAHEWWHGQSLLVTTARSFKGLEADAVIVYDLDTCATHFSDIDLYVACTRARSHVHFLVADKGLASRINSALETVQRHFRE